MVAMPYLHSRGHRRKVWGSDVSARFVGESWKDSLYIGALMNTRGLMELVVLTIGYEMGILTLPYS